MRRGMSPKTSWRQGWPSSMVEKLAEIIRRNFDLRPGSIIEDLHLRETKFCPTAAYGHFGRADLDLPWERLDRVAQLKEEK